MHLNFGECWLKKILGWIENPSLYEQYTKGLGGNLPFGNYPKARFDTARRYWHTEDKNPGLVRASPSSRTATSCRP